MNKHVIKSNLKHGLNDPPITVKGTNRNDYGHEADIYYDGKLIGQFKYTPDKPLSCGARLYFQTTECEVVTRTHETKVSTPAGSLST